MFAMGLTLKLSDFAEVVKRPVQVIVGVLAQFIIMPLLAVALTLIFSLDPLVSLGIILVGCCPGGTSSNVITFLSRGDVALSVTITALSTLLAPVITPLLLNVYAGKIIEINVLAMMMTIAKIVLIPIILGLFINQYWGNYIRSLTATLPLISVTGIVLIIAIVIAIVLSKARIVESGVLILSLVMIHNLFSYGCGYLLARWCGFSVAQQRAIMIEVGMQNSGLGTTLATAFFNPLVAVPSVLFSVWHNISGALVAYLCTRGEK